MNENIDKLCLKIKETMAQSGISPEVNSEINNLLDEIASVSKAAYEKGRTDQKHEDLDDIIILTKREINILETSLVKKILSVINAKYDLDGGEVLVNTKDIYELVAGFCPLNTGRTS
jgi:hypothetical protein